MPHEGGEAGGQESIHPDEDPLIDGEGSSVLTRLKQSFPAFSWRYWRRAPVAQTQSTSVPDVEAGNIPAESNDNSNTTSGESAQEANDGEVESNSPRRALERLTSSGESSSGRQGILGGLLSLGSSALPKSSNSSVNLTQTCLICLETLTPEDFESGDAITLDCQCRGEMAVRHRTCAEKWAHVKGNRICDICKTEVKNLPDVPPRPAEASTPVGVNLFEESEAARQQIFAAEQVPGGADMVFDCIRVTWVVMICVLFFDMSLANALWAGLIVGLAYTVFVRAMSRHQLAVMLREQQRQNAAESPGQHPHIVHVV